MKRTQKAWGLLNPTYNEVYQIRTSRQRARDRAYMDDRVVRVTITYDDGKPKRKAKRGRG